MQIKNEEKPQKLVDLEQDVAQCGIGDPASAGVVIAIYKVVKAIF